jgi:Peptidase family M28
MSAAIRIARPWTVLAGLLVAGCAEPDAREQPWVTASTATITSDTGEDTASDDAEASSLGEDDGHADDDASSQGEHGSSDDAGSSTGAPDCELPDAAAPWLDDHLREVIGTLSGELAIMPGVFLSDRATASRRAQSAAWLIARLGEHGVVAEAHDYGSGTNVVARIEATGTSLGTYVIGAHYDTVPGSPGADDNASGTAVVTALARWLVDVPCRSHDVLIVAFDEEEIGLVGSSAFAAKLVTDDEPVVAVHTIDQIGWDADGDRAIEIERPDPGLFEFYDDVAALVPGLGALQITDTGFTDHVSFRAAGFAATGLSEEYVSGDTTPYYHSPDDSYATVDFGFVATVATLVNRAFGRAVGEP